MKYKYREATFAEQLLYLPPGLVAGVGLCAAMYLVASYFGFYQPILLLATTNIFVLLGYIAVICSLTMCAFYMYGGYTLNKPHPFGCGVIFLSNNFIAIVSLAQDDDGRMYM